MMFPFPKLDNKMIFIIGVILIIYVLTLEKPPEPIKKIKEQVNVNVVKPVKELITNSTVQNPFKETEQRKILFTQRCKNGMNMPPGSCNDESFTQDKECPTISEMLNKRRNKQQEDFKKSRNLGLPFPENEGPSSQVKYIGKQDDNWFNSSQYETIQKVIEDPSRMQISSEGNVIPAGGDTRDWPETQDVDQTEVATLLLSLPTKGNNPQMNSLSK